MNRKIVIETCRQCPHQKLSSKFTPGGSKPLCTFKGFKDLPIVIMKDQFHKRCNRATFIIPGWCPLPKDNSK